MPSTLSEVEEQATQERGFAAGPSNPRSQHAYDGSVKTPGRPGWVLGAAVIGLSLVLASVLGLWLLRSVRRLNRQVARLNRQTEQFDKRLQGAEQHVKSLDQKASQVSSSQASAAPAAAVRPDQSPDRVPDQVSDQGPRGVKGSQGTSLAQTQLPPPATSAAPQPRQATKKTEEFPRQRDADFQKLKQSLGQIAETRRTTDGVVMTLGEKSIRFDTGQSNVSPQYRGILNRIARAIVPLKAYSIYVYAYTDDGGTRDYNQLLSTRRARAVRDALVKAGISPSLISAQGFGKSKPLVRESNPKARVANRRVEIGITDSTLLSARQSASKTVAKPSANR